MENLKNECIKQYEYSILYAEEEWKVTGTSSVTSSSSTLPLASAEPAKLYLVIFDQVWVQMRSHSIGISREDEMR